MKTKVVTTMMAPGSFLVVICAVLVYGAGLGNTAPTLELSKTSSESTAADDGGGVSYPATTMASLTSPSNDAKVWPPQKPSRSKHIIKSNLYKKPTKDKGVRTAAAAASSATTKEKPFYSSTLVPTIGYDVEKDNLSHHKEAPTTAAGTVVDNVNGPKDYKNKTRINTTTFSPSFRRETIFTNVDDDVVDDDGSSAGKDIDFISIARTTKSDETYATAPATTEGYHAKTGTASTTATMQLGLVENPNFNAEATNAKMSTTKSVQDIKSIPTPTMLVAEHQLTMNASVSSSSSSSSSSLPLSLSTSVPPKLDVGHDGVKITKKKQLFDKHFIAAPPNPVSSSSSGSMHLPISKDNPWPPLSKNKPTKSISGNGKKLMEVPNGYLGPIMMKEKTFSVSHRGKKPKPSIVEQLKDKKLVEIIAPTALMEPTIKVKSSIPPPEFIAIDSSSSTSTTTTTTTEGPSVPPPVPTVATNKEEGIETATTYFLVVTQDSKITEKPAEMQPLNSGEIETTLKEIYTEVLNAMEEASKKKSATTPTESSKINEKSDVTPSTMDRIQFAETDNLLSTSNPDFDQHRSATTDHLTSSVTVHVTASEPKRLTTSGIDVVLPSMTDRNSMPTTVLRGQESTSLPSTYPGSSTQLPSYPVRSGRISTVSIDGSTSLPSSPPTATDHFTAAPVSHHKFSTKKLPNLSATMITDQNRRSYPTTDVTLTITDHASTFTPSNAVTFTSSDPSTKREIQDRMTTKFEPVTDTVSSTPTPMTHHRLTPKNNGFTDNIPTTDGPSSTTWPTGSQNKNRINSKKMRDPVGDPQSTLPIVHHDFTTIHTASISPKTVNHNIAVESLTARTEETPITTSKPTIHHAATLFSSNSNPSEMIMGVDDILKELTKDSPMTNDRAEMNPMPTGRIDSPTSTITDRRPTLQPVANERMLETTTDRSFTHDSSSMTLTTTDHILTVHNSDGTKTITSRSKPGISERITDHSIAHDDFSSQPPSTTSSIIDRDPITSVVSNQSPTFATITSDTFKTSSPLKPTHDSEQTESKISDIQIEVYDSTVEPILASTNFRGNPDTDRRTTKQGPSNSLPQERFTQYVVDKATDFATQDSNSVGRASGKPEPAAIEIHINVSEGFGNESEDLEFSYRQADFRKETSKKPGNTNFITHKPFDAAPQNETSNEAAEEIVVEIIDSNSNSTENSASRENLNVNPIFTFRTDDDSQVELKNVKYYPDDRKEGKKSTDDFFVPHLGQQPPGAIKPMMDRDSDTIFYISNTEVKVGESLPTTNTYDAQLKKSRLESQFFPANYEERKQAAPQRYEEDILLSPLKNRVSDPLKVVRGPLDISYVGESVMEVEQVTVTTTIPPPMPGSTPDVIIQPAVLPEMAIGVPVIGELPPQIELKEIDFMPNFDGNKEESSIQYGGDLIDEGGAMGAGFDMDSYPLGNLGAISSQTVLNHRVNHLKRDELTADLVGSSETTDGNDLLRRSNDSLNGTVIGEKMGNATAYSVMEEPPAADGELHFTDLQTLFTACLATLLPLVLSVVMAFGLRHLYRKYQTNSFNVMGRNSSTDPLDAEKGTGGGGDGDADGVETPEELRASSLAFGASTDSPSLEFITSSNEVNSKPGADGDGRDCIGGIVANGRATNAARSDMDVDCIQAIISEPDYQEENAIFIVNCNIETQQPHKAATAPPSAAIQPQSSTTTTNASNAAAATLPNAGTMQCNYSGANGSITTMTLKNNHLIVETEERNDISRDARETKMHYNNSEKDGVFVVEVSRGADSKVMPSSPAAESEDKRFFNMDSTAKGDKPLSNHEEVQIHPPPPETANIQDEIDSNHLHQIDEVDEFEEAPKITKHSNTGLSQSDLSSSSSVDSNKRYSYGNQELYTIEQQDYTTPSPAATKAPHPHIEPQPPQPENHNDDNGHSENGPVLENGPPSAPNCDSLYPADTDSDVNGHNGVESKPKITAALLKQDTVIVNEMTNGLNHDDEATPHNSMENLSNGLDTCYGDTENGFDSIISLPDPPSTEEIKQMNDIILMDTNQLDSLPPPPPPGASENHHQHHNGNGTENGDSHSIQSADVSPMNTPTKVMSPPTITVASAPPLTTDIPHTNGNCMTGHNTTTSTAGVVVEVSGSS